jgi:hypothetical protein
MPVIKDPPQVRAGGEQAEFVGVRIHQPMIGFQLLPVNAVGRMRIAIGIKKPFPISDKMAGGGSEEGGENDGYVAALIFRPAKQGVAIVLDRQRTSLEAARLLCGAGVVAPETQDIPGQVLMGINDEVHGNY